tara:strand:+ start:3694 stop:3966 length:273 start_codon:yes stop_codon:yes gene_type:complete
MSSENHEAQYYQAVLGDMTTRLERLSEKMTSQHAAVVRLRSEVSELRTLLSVCALFVAAVEGRGLLDENDLYLDMSQRLKHYFEAKELKS